MHFVGAAAVIVYAVPRTSCCASLDRRDLGVWSGPSEFELLFPIPNPRSFKPLLSLRPQPIRFLGIHMRLLVGPRRVMSLLSFLFRLSLHALLLLGSTNSVAMSTTINTMGAFGLRPSGAEPIR